MTSSRIAPSLGGAQDGTLVTPTSDSILPSTTKGVLLQQARDMGITVEERPVPWDEVPTLREVAACGTAVVVTPIKSITRGDQVRRFNSPRRHGRHPPCASLMHVPHAQAAH